MVPVNRKKVNLYQEAKEGLISLIQQTAVVFVGFIAMLLMTGGAPSSAVVTLSFCIGIAFVAWSEQKRIRYLSTKVENSSRSSTSLITLRLSGKGSEFLESFLAAINPLTMVIDFERLQVQENQTFVMGYRILLETLRNPRLEWVELHEGQWRVKPDHYQNLIAWLCMEIQKQHILEGTNEKDGAADDNHTQDIALKI